MQIKEIFLWFEAITYICLFLYIDGTLVVAGDKSKIAILKSQLNKKFKTKDLSAPKKILSMEIVRDKKILVNCALVMRLY